MSYSSTMVYEDSRRYAGQYTTNRISPYQPSSLPPAKAMKVLGYPGTENNNINIKSGNMKKPILHRIQTSLSNSPVETHAKLPAFGDGDATIKQKKLKSSKMTSADKMDLAPYPTRSTHSATPASSRTLDKNFRPIPYAAVVQINMFLDGGSEEDWLARARKAGEPGLGGGMEVGGFKDENGCVWWDADEKQEWTSLLPKPEINTKRPNKYDPWVDFNEDKLDSASSTTSSGSWLSTDKPIVEVESGFTSLPAELVTKATRGASAKPGAYLFPINTDILTASRSDNGRMKGQIPTFSTRNGFYRRRDPPPPLQLLPAPARSSVVLSPGPMATPLGLYKTKSLDGFEDHFVRADPRTIAPKELHGAKTKKSGLSLKAMWGK